MAGHRAFNPLVPGSNPGRLTEKMIIPTIRRPSAWLPIAMSLAALSVVVSHIVISGTARQADEGTEAHLWQLLMAGHPPGTLLFALSSLPRVPPPALVLLSSGDA